VKGTKVALVVALLAMSFGLVVSGVEASPSFPPIGRSQLPQVAVCAATASFDYSDYMSLEQRSYNPKSAIQKAAGDAAYLLGVSLRLAGPPFSGYENQLLNADTKGSGAMNSVFGLIASTCRGYGIPIIILPLPKQP
jgi:hypothetical protein